MSIYALVHQARYSANFITLRHTKTMQTLCSKTSYNNFSKLFFHMHLCYLKANHIYSMLCSASYLARSAEHLVFLSGSRYFFETGCSLFPLSIAYSKVPFKTFSKFLEEYQLNYFFLLIFLIFIQPSCSFYIFLLAKKFFHCVLHFHYFKITHQYLRLGDTILTR